MRKKLAEKEVRAHVLNQPQTVTTTSAGIETAVCAQRPSSSLLSELLDNSFPSPYFN